ncbi:hypothetical protein GCM10008960_03420 [Deinococcus sedimenti]|uniref:Transposase n=1 Tax=Deinococcus sedimenti TaxID=1867090 RepID=A0ABQ2RY46_9DEIO|nr:hypothetical protein GCM10008960_03420 [Deinococcus sedimenti]
MERTPDQSGRVQDGGGQGIPDRLHLFTAQEWLFWPNHIERVVPAELSTAQQVSLMERGVQRAVSYMCKRHVRRRGVS